MNKVEYEINKADINVDLDVNFGAYNKIYD
jgi:hypothetical protein